MRLTTGIAGNPLCCLRVHCPLCRLFLFSYLVFACLFSVCLFSPFFIFCLCCCVSLVVFYSCFVFVLVLLFLFVVCLVFRFAFSFCFAFLSALFIVFFTSPGSHLCSRSVYQTQKRGQGSKAGSRPLPSKAGL